MHLETETERLFLRPLRVDDTDFIRRLLNSPGWLQFIGDRNIKTDGDALDYIRKITDNEKYYYSVFVSKETQEAMGIITFLYREQQAFPDIGFAILPEFENNGYALEACQIYMHELRNQTNVEKILAITMPDNRKSIRLLEKLGLQFESNFTDGNTLLQRYAMTISRDLTDC